MLSQLQILNKVLSTKDYSLITLNNLTDNQFSKYKDEFNFIKNHYEKYHTIPDIPTFLNVFNDFKLIEVSEPDSYLIEQLLKDYNTYYLAERFNKMKGMLENDEIDKAVEYFLKSVENLHQGSTMVSTDIIRNTEERYNAYDERTEDFSKFYITTGFSELDQVIGGWDRQEEYGLIVARTNVGKSFVALKMAVAAAKQGLNVGIYSGEMTTRKVGYRVDTLVGHIPNGSLIHGNIGIKNDYRKYLDSLSSTIKGSIKVITPNDINGPADVPSLRLFIDKEKLDILFVDQISLLEDARHGKGTVERTANISKDIKNLQVMTKIPVIAVCQQNRTKLEEEGKQDTTQIAQSDRLGQDATCVIFLDKKDDNMKLTLVKSRDSENGLVLNYNVDFNKGFWTYVPSEKDGISEDKVSELEHSYDVDTQPSGENIEWEL